MADVEVTPGFADRMCVETWSPYYDAYHMKVGVKLNGKAIFDVVEYCVSEGWVRRIVWLWTGKMKFDHGRVVTVTHKGTVELYRR